MVKTTDLVAALRCCTSDEIDECLRCPLRTAGDCFSWMKRAAADLIENQQREIEALRFNLAALSTPEGKR